MTRFRSRAFGAKASIFLLGLALAGCETSSGIRTARIAEPAIATAYIPLHKATHLGLDSDEAAAVAIAPGIAATCAHNAEMLDPKRIIAQRRDYDLLFFTTTRKPAPAGPLVAGSAVTAYGQGADGELRSAHGTVRHIEPGTGAPHWFTFEGDGSADAGPGFSGGPVVDDHGRLVGITFGYKDAANGHQRQIYAYDMARVKVELAALEKTLPRDLN